MHLANTKLFRGLQEDEIKTLLTCLNTFKRDYQKGETIL